LGGIVKNIDTEILFDIPQSWAWARLKDVFIINPRNAAADNTEASFIPMPLISDGFSNEHTFETRRWGDIKSGFTHFQDGDVVLQKSRPALKTENLLYLPV